MAVPSDDRDAEPERADDRGRTYSRRMAASPASPLPARTALAVALGALTAAHVWNNRLGPGTTAPVSIGTSGLLLLIARQSGVSWSELGMGRSQVERGLRWGVSTAGGVAAVYTAGVLLPATRPLFADQRAERRTKALLRQALWDVPVGTVLLEEVGFRAVLPALFGRVYGPAAGQAVPVVLFGLWHVLPSAALPAANPALARVASGRRTTEKASPEKQQPGDRPSRWATAGSAVATTALGGVVFSALRRRTDSLLAPALLHTAFNSLGYLAAWTVNRRLPPSPGRR